MTVRRPAPDHLWAIDRPAALARRLVHRRMTALGAAVMLLVSACSGHSSGHVPAPTVPPPTATSTTVPPTTTTVALSAAPYTWSRATSSTLDLGGGATATLAAMLPPGAAERWLIAGTRISSQGLPIATVWTSPDGVDWSATALSSLGVPSQAEAATQYRNYTVVVGSTGIGADRQAAVWLSSAPGAPWTSVPLTASASPSYMSAVAGGALGVFASGSAGGQIGFWSSTNGSDWSVSTNAERAIGSPPTAQIHSLLEEGAVVYAAGSIADGPATAAALWSSGDGINWRQITSAATAFAGPGDRMIDSIAPLGNGLVAVGAISSGTSWEPTAWISPDGLSWSQPTTDFPGDTATGSLGATGSVSPTGSTMESVSAETTLADTNQLYAVGGDPEGGPSTGRPRQYLWESTDGLSWTEVPLPSVDAASSGWRATLVASSGPTTVVADTDPGQPHVLTDIGGTWHQPSSNPAVFGPVQPFAYPTRLVYEGGRTVMTVSVNTPPQTIGALSTTAVTLASVDGRKWTAGSSTDLVDSPSTLPPGATTGIRFGTGWVAVGQTAATTELGATGSADARSWHSTNGVSWTEGTPLTTTGSSDPNPDPGGLCTTGSPTSRVVAVGSRRQATTGSEAAAWTSSDGAVWTPAQIQPAPFPGGSETMNGCFATAGGFVAFGSSTSPGGQPAPALWRSSNGATWSRQATDDFSATTPYPFDAVSRRSTTWLATAGPVISPSGPVGPDGPGAYQSPNPVADDLWISMDRGSTWTVLDTGSSPWVGLDQSHLFGVTFVGSAALVAGSVDGRLAVWIGQPVLPTATSGTTTTTGLTAGSS